MFVNCIFLLSRKVSSGFIICAVGVLLQCRAAPLYYGDDLALYVEGMVNSNPVYLRDENTDINLAWASTMSNFAHAPDNSSLLGRIQGP